MTRLAIAATVVGLGIATGCGDPQPPYEVASGAYQLSTAQITGDCKLDWALRPGPIAVGSVMPTEVVASPVSIAVKVCGHAAQDPTCTGQGDAYSFSMSRDGDDLVGSQPWGVPGCGTPAYAASLTVAGAVTGNDSLSLTWTATITSPDPNWTCDGYRVCSSTIDQRMARATGL